MVQISQLNQQEFNGCSSSQFGGVFLPSSVQCRYYKTKCITLPLRFNLLLSSFLLSFSTAEGFFSRSDNSTVTGWETFLQALGYFLNMFFGSAALGTLTGLISALVSSRHSPCVCLYFICVRILFSCLALFQFPNSLISFWNTLTWGTRHRWSLGWWSSLPTFLMDWQRESNYLVGQYNHIHIMNTWIFLYVWLFLWPPSPTCFSLPTGIMSILFAGIVMSHYTHHNLSPVTQILMQQTLRTVAFMCGQ